ncbi:MAG: hypothetical protein R8F63_04835 [Acidimicrobiales bacterium]|nr:hypothetical protein [Acidimicrobiales bacterium]
MSLPSSAPPSPLADGPIEQLYITAWDDPVVDGIGHDPRSGYVEQFWLGVLGPSTIWFLRHCSHELDRAPRGFVLELEDAAGALGLGHNGGRNSALARTIARACHFSAARPIRPGELEVRRRLPPLTRSQLHRLPDLVQRRHERFVELEQSTEPTVMARRARRLALGLVECGDGVDDAELQLSQWRFHPSVAAEAVRWAWNRHREACESAPESPRSGRFGAN